MQIPIRDHEQLSGVVTVRSRPIDVSNVPLLTATMVVHSIAGTSPRLTVSLQTSDNQEDWTGLSGSFNRQTAGTSVTSFAASSDPYGRFVRAVDSLTGADAVVVYSLWLDASPST